MCVRLSSIPKMHNLPKSSGYAAHFVSTQSARMDGFNENSAAVYLQSKVAVLSPEFREKNKQLNFARVLTTEREHKLVQSNPNGYTNEMK